MSTDNQCEYCGGTGKVEVNSWLQPYTEPCSHCSGANRIPNAAPGSPRTTDEIILYASVIAQAAEVLQMVADSGVKLPPNWNADLLDALSGISYSLSGHAASLAMEPPRGQVVSITPKLVHEMEANTPFAIAAQGPMVKCAWQADYLNEALVTGLLPGDEFVAAVANVECITDCRHGQARCVECGATGSLAQPQPDVQAKVASQQAGAVAWLVVDAKGKRFTIYNPMLAEVVKREAEQTGSTLTVKAVCEIPPTGWYCTRQPGHDGPCAAWENVRPSVTMPDPEKACAIWTTRTTSKAESNAFLAGARAMLTAAPEVQS